MIAKLKTKEKQLKSNNSQTKKAEKEGQIND